MQGQLCSGLMTFFFSVSIVAFINMLFVYFNLRQENTLYQVCLVRLERNEASQIQN
jgi:hypothetical protein